MSTVTSSHHSISEGLYVIVNDSEQDLYRIVNGQYVHLANLDLDGLWYAREASHEDREMFRTWRGETRQVESLDGYAQLSPEQSQSMLAAGNIDLYAECVAVIRIGE